MLTSKKKFIINVGLVIVLNLFFLFLIFLIWQNIDSKKQFVAEIKKELSFYEKRISNVKRIERVLATNQDKQAEVESLFLNKETIINFIKELEYLSGEAGVDLEMKSVSLPTDKIGKPSFYLKVTGSFARIYRYLAFLENGHYQLTLDKIFIQKLSQDKEWEANLELRFLNFEYNEI